MAVHVRSSSAGNCQKLRGSWAQLRARSVRSDQSRTTLPPVPAGRSRSPAPTPRPGSRSVTTAEMPACSTRAGLQHGAHRVPGLEHLAAVDALEREHVRDHLAPVDVDGLAGQAEHRDPAAVVHVLDHLRQGGGMAGHLQPDVEALAHAESPLRVPDARLARRRPPGPRPACRASSSRGAETSVTTM